jgi:hypothetical protein
MIIVEVSKVMNRPIAEVFAFVANFENHPKSEIDFQEVKLLSPTSSPLHLCKIILILCAFC